MMSQRFQTGPTSTPGYRATVQTGGNVQGGSEGPHLEGPIRVEALGYILGSGCRVRDKGRAGMDVHLPSRLGRQFLSGVVWQLAPKAVSWQLAR